jgi:hypothetical protein
VLDIEVIYNLSARRGCLTWKLPENSVLFSSCNTKCDDTCAVTRFCLSAQRTSPFKSTGASVQSTTGSQFVRISGSNAGYTMFRDSVKNTGYPLHSPVSLHFPSRASPFAITFQLDSSQLPLCNSRRCWGIRRRCATWIGVLRSA